MLPIQILSSFVVAASAIAPDVSSTLSNILANTDQSPLYTYPTDLTRGIVPGHQKALHSHNDYWRDIPFYSALSVGAVSVEADVWLVNGTLHVSIVPRYPARKQYDLNLKPKIGHEVSALTNARTFDSLYIQPILDTLRRQNPSSPFVTTPTKNGVFDTAGTQTLYLWVDVKTDGETTWPAVISALEPLRQGGWLSTVNSTAITYNPVTVIGTGNTPLDQIQNLTSRDYFYDGPIPYLNSTFSNITSLVSPICSTDFMPQFGTINGTSFNSTQLALLRSQVAVAHSKGIMVRYWDLPGWPTSTRNGVWRQLYNEGVDLINVDDLIAGAGFSDESNYW
ncbi:MAG: hypothetical protein M1827_000253 [Pycnora praestabilis]|nr:MAG: hypothetical protein M1827_000253 [Pycnora praestabilis]